MSNTKRKSEKKQRMKNGENARRKENMPRFTACSLHQKLAFLRFSWPPWERARLPAAPRAARSGGLLLLPTLGRVPPPRLANGQAKVPNFSRFALPPHP